MFSRRIPLLQRPSKPHVLSFSSVNKNYCTSINYPGSNHVLVQVQDGIREIRLNRPSKKNAFTLQMYDNVTRALNEAEDDKGTHLTVLTGTGDYFSSGTDLQDFKRMLVDPAGFVKEFFLLFGEFAKAFIDFKKPLIGILNGSAIGAGVTFLPHLDVVYSVYDAYFQTPFGAGGVCPELCSSHTFPSIMGTSKAMEMLLFNEPMTAKEAQATGLVTRTFPRESFGMEVAKRLRAWRQLPLETLVSSKELIKGPHRHVLHQVYMEEARCLQLAFASEYFRSVLRNLKLDEIPDSSIHV